MAGPSQMSGVLRRALVWVAVALAVALIARQIRERDEQSRAPAPSAPTPNDEILADLIPQLATAIERRDARFVMDHVATSFREAGGLDYYDVRALVEMAAFGEKPVGTRVETLELTPVGDSRQVAAGTVSFARGETLEPGELLPRGAVTYALEVVFAKEGPRWVALSGSYRRLSAPGATTPGTPPTATP